MQAKLRWGLAASILLLLPVRVLPLLLLLYTCYLLTFNELMTSCTCSGSLRVSLLLPVYFCLCRPSGRPPEQLCFRRLCLSVYICVHACVWPESLQTGLQSTSSLILISYGELLWRKCDVPSIWSQEMERQCGSPAVLEPLWRHCWNTKVFLAGCFPRHTQVYSIAPCIKTTCSATSSAAMNVNSAAAAAQGAKYKDGSSAYYLHTTIVLHLQVLFMKVS